MTPSSTTAVAILAVFTPTSLCPTRDIDRRSIFAHSSELALAEYFEECARVCGDPGLAANWVRGDLLGSLNRDDLSVRDSPISATDLGLILKRINDDTISGKIAKTVFAAFWDKTASSVDDYIEEQGLVQVTDTGSLEPIVEKIIQGNPKQVDQYRSGKTRVLSFFVGQVMKETGGKANPKQVNELVLSKLEQ